MLEVTDLNAYYGKSHILRGVNLKIENGEIVSLLGRNGVGRSTTCKAIMGEVIHFPNKGLLKNLNKKPKLSQEEISRIQLLNDKRTADQLSESLAIDILTVLQEHISDMQKNEFIADLAILIEVIKSTLYREHDLKHPIQEIIEMLLK